jgi:hypothetical protein
MEKGLVPIEVKRRQTPVRLIKSMATIYIASRTCTGVRKLPPQEANLIASIIYTGVVKYNDANGHKLNPRDLKRIQKELAKLDVFTYDEEIAASEAERKKRAEQLGRTINKTDRRGFLIRRTGGLVLVKKDYDAFRRKNDSKAYIKTITHEGFHYLTNKSKRKYGMERVIAEGSDESFIVKTFPDGKFSTVMGDQKRNGAVHYNFCSKTRYSLSVSLLNMLGIMVNINPEVSELKLNKKFTDSVKQKYGEDFYKKLINRAECWLSPKKYEKIRNETRYLRRLQGFVLRTIVNDIIDNVKDPEDAVKRLRALQRTEAWSARILLRKKDPKTENVSYEVCRDFEFWYRRAYVKTIEKLQQRGYQNLDNVKACRYKATKFAPLRKIEYEIGDDAKLKFFNKAFNTKIFFKYYYGKQNFAEVVGPATIRMYELIMKEYDEERKQKEQQKNGQVQTSNIKAQAQPQKISIKPQPQTQQQKNPPKAKITPIPKNPNGRGDDDGPQFGGF